MEIFPKYSDLPYWLLMGKLGKMFWVDRRQGDITRTQPPKFSKHMESGEVNMVVP